MKRMILAAALCQAAVAVLAQSAHVEASGNATAQAGSFRCGGIGQGEQERMKAEAPQHDLMLTFATPSGAYLADVDVQIRRGKDVVLQGHCGGPLMLVDLAPKGSYEITATSNGREQRKTVSLGASKPARLSFVWPQG